ncbi:MAG: hypothetical protein J5797_09365 [Prevotella sp.]|nr:hypothetical protein [Prevotella sp.]
MRKILLMVAVALMAAMSAQAQKIQIVDNDGNAIPLVSVLTEDGVLIGTTGMDGVLADVKGAAKVAVTHVAYKPQLVTVASLQDGRITMEDIDYGIDEVVVKPKPYLYVEYYYRAFSYIGDSLRVYTAGILPMAHEIQNKYKGKVQGYWAFGGAANKALTWNTQSMEDNVQGLAEDAAWPAERWLANHQKYETSIEPEDENHFIIKNPEEVLGHIVYSDGLSYTTLDVDRMRIYGERTNGKERVAKFMEDRDYTYRYTEVFRLDEDGKVQPENFVMEQVHLEYDKKEGRKVNVAYLYAVDKGYMDKDEVKARGKEISKGRKGDMSLDELAEYERAHNIPALSPEQQRAIQTLTKQTGKKK